MKRPVKKGKNKTDNSGIGRWAAGLAFVLFSFFLLISAFSYVLYWKADQKIATLPLNETQGEEVLNWGNRLGVKAGHFLVSQSFGVFGVLIPIILLVLALKVMKPQKFTIGKTVVIGIIATLLGSVSLGYIGSFFGDAPGAFGTGLGGAHGIYIAQWLDSYIGLGTGLVLLLLIVLLAVYINKSTITLINRAGRGLADTAIDLGSAVAGKASDLLQPGRNNTKYEEPDEVEETEEEEEEEAPWDDDDPIEEPDKGLGIESRVDYDYRYSEDAEEPIAPPKRRKFGFKESEEEEVEFYVRTAGDDLPVAAGPDSYNTPVTRYSEEIASEFGIRDESGEAVVSATSLPTDVIDAYAGNPSEASTLPPDAIPNDQSTSIIVDDNFSVDKHVDATVADDEIDTGFYDHTLDLSYYQKPPVELLEDHKVDVVVTEAELIENKNQIIRTLENFGIKIDKIKATIGPTVTLYEIVPAPGVRISKIKNLEDDIALSLSALGIRIIAPMPGKGTIGIEVPNKDKEVVSMYSVIKSVKFQESTFDLPIVLGKTIQNETFVIDLAKRPHLLVAGATGQGKSVGLNAILASLLYKKHPSEIKFVLVDPKKVELTLYQKLEKHFLAKLPSEDEAIITDTQKVIYTLNSLCMEMDSRYDLLRKAEVRHLKEYNEKFTKRRLSPLKGHRYLPYIVVIIDEFADMIMTAGREIETPIARLAQLARAVGIHLVIATQRPTTNIITGVIKANFPARIAFRVSSMIDSRTIIDQPGANQLIGRGDMLVSTGSDITRVQCAFIDTPEVENITEFISNQQGYTSAYELPDYVPENEMGAAADLGARDALFEEAARAIVAQQQGSTSLIQRKFSIGYNRAGRIMDQLEQAGIVGRAEGSKPREVKITDLASLENYLDSFNHF